MGVIPALCIVWLLGSCFSVDNFENINLKANLYTGKDLNGLSEDITKDSPKRFTLDLSKDPDRDKVYFMENNTNDLIYKAFTSKDGNNFDRVAENGEVIWESGKGAAADKCGVFAGYHKRGISSIVFLYLQGGFERRKRYFSKENEVWIEIKNEVYNEKLMKIKIFSERDNLEKDAWNSNNLSGKCSTHASPTDYSINISNPDPYVSKFFRYHYNDNQILLIIVRESVPISRLKNGNENLWIAVKGEKLEYSRVYLKNNNPELVLVAANMHDWIRYDYYVKNGANKWNDTCNYSKRIEELRVPAKFKGTFILNIADDKDTDECRIFEAELLGVTTKHFFTKPGYTVTEVVDGGVTLWTASGEEKCISCFLNYKEHHNSLLVLVLITGNKKSSVQFEKMDSCWIAIVEDEFYKKRDAMSGDKFVKPEKCCALMSIVALVIRAIETVLNTIHSLVK